MSELIPKKIGEKAHRIRLSRVEKIKSATKKAAKDSSKNTITFIEVATLELGYQ